MGDIKTIQKARADIGVISKALDATRKEYLEAKKKRDIIAASCTHEKLVRTKNLLALAREAFDTYIMKSTTGNATAQDTSALKKHIARFKNETLKIKTAARECNGKSIEVTSKPTVVESTTSIGHPMDKGLYFGAILSSAGAIDYRTKKGVDRYAVSKTEAKFIFSFFTFFSATLAAGYRFMKNKAVTLDLASIGMGAGLHILLSRKAMLELGLHVDGGALIGTNRVNGDKVSGYYFSFGASLGIPYATKHAIYRFDLLKVTNDIQGLKGVPEEHDSFGSISFGAGITALF